MADLISCPGCGQRVSPRAPSCPSCGEPIAGDAAPVYIDQAPAKPAGFGSGFNIGCGVIAAIIFCLLAIPVGCTMCMGMAATTVLEDIDLPEDPEGSEPEPKEIGK